MRARGWPAVVGELLAGILLGPTVLGKVWPDAKHWLFPGNPEQQALLTAVGRLGVLLLLLLTGFEIDARLVKSRLRSVLAIGFCGTSVPLVAGFGLGMVLPDLLVGNPAERTLFAMFMAVAMSISALAVLAKVLFDLQAMGRELSQTMVAVAMTDDLVGWILLSTVVSFAAGQVAVVPALTAVGSALGFLLVAATAGRWGVNLFLTWVDNRVSDTAGQVSAVVVLTMLSAAATHALGLEPMLGALVMGVLVGQARRFRSATEDSLRVLVSGFLSPVFFASAGLKVDLVHVFHPSYFGWALLVLATAFVCKLVGAWLGGWAAGFSGWERLAMGVGLNARGSMEIIVATVGLNLGILTSPSYSMVVMISVASCLMTPPMLRAVFARIPLNEAEVEKAAQEEAASFWPGFRRQLLALRGGSNDAFLAQLATALAQAKELESTIMEEPAGAELRRSLEASLPLSPKLKQGTLAEVVAESGRGFGLLLLGASSGRFSFLHGWSDRVVSQADCPVAIVRGAPHEVRSILFPTSGSSDGTALDLAAGLAAALGAQLTLLHVLEVDEFDRDLRRLERLGHQVLQSQVEAARRIVDDCTTMIRQSADLESEIMQVVEQGEFDLVVVRGVLRSTSRRAFLGHRMERLLARTVWPVLVVCS